MPALGWKRTWEPTCQQTLTRLQHLSNAALKRGLSAATEPGVRLSGVADAWGLGVAKVPAVVVDRRYVIYGEPDVALALSRIARYRREQP